MAAFRQWRLQSSIAIPAGRTSRARALNPLVSRPPSKMPDSARSTVAGALSTEVDVRLTRLDVFGGPRAAEMGARKAVPARDEPDTGQCSNDHGEGEYPQRTQQGSFDRCDLNR